MKNTILGGVGILSGVILFGFTLVAAAVHSLSLREFGYSTDLGVYGTALQEVGVIPIIISVVLFGFGIGFWFMGKEAEKST